MDKVHEMKLGGFNMIYGVGSESHFSDAILNVRQIRQGVPPCFLVSVHRMMRSEREMERFDDFLAAVGHDVCRSKLVLDSAGFQIANCVTRSAKVPPERIAAIYNSKPCAMGVGADAPFHKAPTKLNRVVNRKRFERFGGVYRKPPGHLLYLPVHDQMIVGDNYTVAKRQRWVNDLPQEMRDYYDGWAMRLGFDYGLAVEALAALWPWSEGVDSLHILGTANISLLCLFAYLDHLGVYSRLSLDATNFSSSSLRYPQIYRFENQRPTALPLKGMDDPTIADRLVREMEECRGFDGGACEVCAFMQAKIGKTLGQLFREYLQAKAGSSKDHKKVINRKFNEWVVTHGIAVVERFIAELKTRAQAGVDFFRFLEEIKEDATFDVIEDVIDPVLEGGPQAYAKHITRINNRKVYEKPSGRAKHRKMFLIQPRVHRSS